MSILYERRETTAIVTLNRPEQRNAVDSGLSQAAGEALECAAHDDRVRAVVVTGAGTSFCAGADLKALARGESTLAPGHQDWGFAGLVQHWIDKPLIAAVNGLALGGGAEIVLACDLAVIDEDAAIAFPEVHHGLISAGGGTIRLAQQIPRKWALDLLLTGRRIDAATAHHMGLANSVAPSGSALTAALELAESLAALDSDALEATKSAVYATAHCSDWQQETWDISDVYKKRAFDAFARKKRLGA